MSQYAAEKFSQTLTTLLKGMTEYMFEYDEDMDAVNYNIKNEDVEYTEADVSRCQHILEQFRDAVFNAQQNDQTVMAAVQQTVEALNELNDACEHTLIETDQREYICQFIDEVIEFSGIDVAALAATQEVERYEITDQWREW